MVYAKYFLIYKRSSSVRYEILTVMTMKVTVLCDLASCSLVGLYYQRSKEHR
jgi:hypothetical protein